MTHQDELILQTEGGVLLLGPSGDASLTEKHVMLMFLVTGTSVERRRTLFGAVYFIYCNNRNIY